MYLAFKVVRTISGISVAKLSASKDRRNQSNQTFRNLRCPLALRAGQSSPAGKSQPTPNLCRNIFSLALRFARLSKSRALRNQRRAQLNSVASTARPKGITMNAGPGKTIIATPIAMMAPPSRPTRNRLIPGDSP